VCFEDQDVEGRGILILTLEKYNDSVWPGLVSLGIGASGVL
jgi:hypothetical protein